MAKRQVVKEFLGKIVRAIGRKKGKKISNKINSEIIKKYLFNFSSDFNNNNIILDIGSGNGENTLYLSNKYPDYLIVASEVYEDGIINLCNNLSNRGINNVKIYNSNVLWCGYKKDR